MREPILAPEEAAAAMVLSGALLATAYERSGCGARTASLARACEEALRTVGLLAGVSEAQCHEANRAGRAACERDGVLSAEAVQ